MIKYSKVSASQIKRRMCDRYYLFIINRDQSTNFILLYAYEKCFIFVGRS